MQRRLQQVTPLHRINHHRERLTQIELLMPRLMQRHLERSRLRLAQQSGKLQSVSPLATLERGYSILLDRNGQAVSDSARVKVGDTLEARLHKGRLQCTVDRIDEESIKEESK